MSFIRSLCILLAGLLVALAHEETIPKCTAPTVEVKRITKDNWKEVIMEGLKANIVVFFLSPTCLECRRNAATEADKLVHMLAKTCEEDPIDQIDVGLVDCSTNTLVCEIFNSTTTSRPIYIERRTAYRQKDLSSPLSAESLHQFVTGGEYKKQEYGALETTVI